MSSSDSLDRVAAALNMASTAGKPLVKRGSDPVTETPPENTVSAYAKGASYGLDVIKAALSLAEDGARALEKAVPPAVLKASLPLTIARGAADATRDAAAGHNALAVGDAVAVPATFWAATACAAPFVGASPLGGPAAPIIAVGAVLACTTIANYAVKTAAVAADEAIKLPPSGGTRRPSRPLSAELAPPSTAQGALPSWLGIPPTLPIAPIPTFGAAFTP